MYKIVKILIILTLIKMVNKMFRSYLIYKIVNYLYFCCLNMFRFQFLEDSLKRIEFDGLNNINYKAKRVNKMKLFTKVIVTY